MSKSVKKLFISILSLIFAVLLFGTVTYAWFSIATSNIVHDLTLGISSDNDFQISLDGINYYDELTNEDIMDLVGNKLELNDVTSQDGLYFSKGGPNQFEQAEKNVDYLSITLFFRTTAFEKNVYLVDDVSREAYLNNDIDGTYIISKGINWQADSTFINGEDPVNDIIKAGDRYVFYAAEAVRIGFVEQRIENNIKDVREDNNLNSKIFDLSRNPIRGYGISYGSLDYFNVKHSSDITPPLTTQNVINELSTFDKYNPYVPLDDNSYILRMIETEEQDPSGKSYYEGKVEMNIWIEGWDADCFDAIYRDLLTIKLNFKASRDIRENTIYT